MHSEVCPICKGLGRIPENYPCWIHSKGTKVCHGCGGKDWVSVKDEYQYVNPYIWPYVQPYEWKDPYRWDTTGTTNCDNDNVIISFKFSKKKK